MKLFKKVHVLSDKKFWSQLNDARTVGIENSKDELEASNKAVTRLSKAVKGLKEDLADLETEKNTVIDKLKVKVDVLEDDRDDVREIVKKEMELDDKAIVLQEMKEQYDKKVSKLKTREESIDNEEESNYKKGYADGVSDGVRKISEITQQDRADAMKIAMVSAASHTSVENIKEINSELRLTEGSKK